MAYFAELDSDNNILNVLVVSDSDVIANGGHQSEQAATWVKNTFGKANPSTIGLKDLMILLLEVTCLQWVEVI